ncbi:MAG: hydrolase TatD, partial [Bacteroidota bacterium]
MIDTHSHLYSSKFDKDKEEVINRAKEVLEAVFLPNIDRNSIEGMHALADHSP